MIIIMARKNKEQGKNNISEKENINSAADKEKDPNIPEDNGGKTAEEREQQKDDIPTDSIISADEKLAELKDKYLRLSAEFDNYRKRTLREKTELIRTASESLIIQIIPVLDDFERAIGFINGEGNIDESKQGIFLIYKKLKDILTLQGLREIESLHNDFDTDLHEAVTKIPANDKKLKGKVVDVIEKGYILGEKVVRYAKVVVGE